MNLILLFKNIVLEISSFKQIANLVINLRIDRLQPTGLNLLITFFFSTEPWSCNHLKCSAKIGHFVNESHLPIKNMISGI